MTLGIAYLMQYGSSGLPLPPPNLAGASLLTVVCLIPLSPFSPGTRKPSPMKELKASLSESKGGEARHAAGCWAKPNQLPENHRLFLLKEEEELPVRPVPPWDIPL